MNEFKSSFAIQLADMLEFREAIGYRADTYRAYLLKFDAYCLNNDPNAAELTEEIVLAWAESDQGNGAGANQAIRGFGDYLLSMGERAYVLPEGYSAQKDSFSAYVFTDKELDALFREIDHIQPNTSNPHMNVIAPVMFRLTYTCGLRPNESRELLCKHVNLNTGEILITNTKKQRERMVVMSDDMLEYTRRYEQRRLSFCSDNLFFFPNLQGMPYSVNTINRVFKSCWAKANPQIPKKELPPVRVYDLRHRMASACLNHWLDQKRDLMVMLPYLRAYMGHLRMDDTLYYVHLLPEKLVKSDAIHWEALDRMLPEVVHNV